MGVFLLKGASKLISFFAFFGLLAAFSLFTIFLPKSDFSEEENRYLEKFPEFSLQSLLSGEYMKGLENYVSDHFAGRLFWIKSKTKMELLQGKDKINGVYVLKDRLAEEMPVPDYSDVDKSLEKIAGFVQKSGKPAYFMLAPTSIGIYSDELSQNAPSYDEKEFIDYVYKKLSENMTTIDVYSMLYSNKDEYIFYRTDHHWTSLGAYYAYYAAGKKMGYAPAPWGSFDIEHASSDFLGTLFSKTLYDNIEPDIIDLYTRKDGANVVEVEINDGRETKKYNSMYFREYLGKKDKYSVFFGTNQPLVTVRTNLKNGGKLLVFKDSYAHSLMPFLAQNYAEITMVDLRYLNSDIEKMVEIEKYDKILFVYNCVTFVTDKNLRKLG